MRECTLRDSVISGHIGRGIHNDGRNVYLDRTSITANGGEGIYTWGGRVQGVDNTIAGNWFGVYLDTGGSATLEDSWWGAANGPAPVGPGDEVSTGVDYTTFRTSPP